MSILLSIFPPLPPYDGLHPLVVHFPIALLFILPVFILLAGLSKAHGRVILLSALVLVVLGTAGAFVATSTGEATERFAEAIPAAKATLHEHEDLAELARNLYIGVMLVIGVATLLVWMKHETLKPMGRLAISLVLALACVYPMSVLARAAHEGGKLVHGFGVRAPLAGSLGTTLAPPATRENGDD